jgi:pyrroloquinoline-quinone synthase
MQNLHTEVHADSEVSPVATDLEQRVALQIQRRPIFENSYFKTLGDGSMDKAGFQRSQAQFFFAVRFFSRPMAALAARLPDSRARMALTRNLAEEHGDFLAEQAHDHTFTQFLSRIGVTQETLAATREGTEVRAFNQALLGTCAMAEPELAIACLGMIEHTFAGISGEIGQAVMKRGWVNGGTLVHYTLHSELDKRHAREFFDEVEPAWSLGGEHHRAIEDGLSLGLYLFDRLYTDLSHIAAHPS